MIESACNARIQRPDAGGPDIFFHIQAFPLGTIPEFDMRVSYDTAVQRSGKIEAVDVRVL
jgi:cold shock CspA family protein